MQPLRVCRYCGRIAYSQENLEEFVKNRGCKYGYETECLSCRRKYKKRWGELNPDKIQEYYRKRDLIRNPKRIKFQGKTIHNKTNPRTNVCSECGRKYPEELKQQTFMHHDKYDSINPLAHTRELCNSCHARLHFPTGVKH